MASVSSTLDYQHYSICLLLVAHAKCIKAPHGGGECGERESFGLSKCQRVALCHTGYHSGGSASVCET